jgi:phosphatidylglycerophosphatase A
VNRFLLWVAQGLGVGRMPFAPGTFGSFAGLLWFALLLLTGHLWLYVLGTIAGLALSVWLCGVGERLLGKRDPGSVVLDEIMAMPVCFLGWVGKLVSDTGSLPAPEFFFSARHWLPTLGVVAAFRFFDILKPWPVRQSQALHSGLGITADDVLAAAYVNLAVLAYGTAQAFLLKPPS